MRLTVFAILLATLPLSAGLAADKGNRGSTLKGAKTDRALRAEARSRMLTTEICRGCGVSTAPHTSSPTFKVSARNIRQFRGRGTTVLGLVSPLPLTSRAEAQSAFQNQLTAQQQRSVQFQQQTQFEINQLRSELQRDFMFR